MASRSALEQLKHHLLASLGMAPVLLLGACSGELPSSDEGGVTTNPGGSATTLDDGNDGNDGTTSGGSGVPSNPSTSATTSPDPGDGDPSDPDAGDGDPDPGDGDPDPGDGDPDGGIRLDFAQPDLPPLGDCTVTQIEPSVLDEYPDCPIVLDDGVCWSNLYWGCVELQPDQTCADACMGGSCVEDWTNCAGDTVYDFPSELCGPYEIEGECCTLAEIGEFCGSDGRPFVVAGVTRQAPLHGSTQTLALTHLPEGVRERLATHWAAVARAEHASIASFAQFGSRLLALGAPALLVRAALAAADDEVRHAEFALARASECCGSTLAFGSLDTHGAADPRESIEETVLACVREGCIGETLAALELATLAEACTDEWLAASLRAIAADEARHAALAWRFVQWALAREPGLAARVTAVFDRGLTGEVEAELFTAREREQLRAHGCLPADERRQLEREGLRELVWPCVETLLRGRSASVGVVPTRTGC
jgi:hypothetical protein